MYSRACRLWSILVLVLALQLAVAQGSRHLARRQQDSTTALSSQSATESSTTVVAGSDQKAHSTSIPNSRDASVTTSEGASATDNSTLDPLPTTSNTNVTANDSNLMNATIPAGQLPLTPQITPGWGVSGVIMLITGLTYTLVGIKNRWIHTFFSTAYMTSLGVAVLIIYVMSVPVSPAIQGGYVVAVIMSGCAVGAASMFFKELTEGFGCALGGFCISMWLLCLTPGGLLRPVPSKAIFIAVFTLAGFAFYFSRWTRDWTLIVAIAFSGATVTMLGLDCFSRAGLKEFWAYIWDVNSNLFPLGANTYPVTKGIRVELAAIIFIFLVGIISQIKLWRIVRDKREKRALERAEGQRNLELEEENVGRQVEEMNARERRQWERVYGQGTAESSTDSSPSDLGESTSEKKLRNSHNGCLKPRDSVDVAEISESEQSRCGNNPLMSSEEARDGKITVRVAADDVPDSPTDFGDELDEKAVVVDEKRLSSVASQRLSHRTSISKRASQTQTISEAPEVVPLPFNVPLEEEPTPEDDRSSVATFAEDEHDGPPAVKCRRESLAKHLSHGSATLIQSPTPGPSRWLEDLAHGFGESSEGLIDLKSHRKDDDNESLAATVDGESVSGGYRRSLRSVDAPISVNEGVTIAEFAQLPDVSHRDKSKCGASAPNAWVNHQEMKEGDELETSEQKSQTKSQVTGCDTAEKVNSEGSDGQGDITANTPANRTKSIVSASSLPASLIKEHLPRSLSRVAMSYRTNEWAKHLGHAETPDPDELHIEDVVRPASSEKDDKERSVPVNVSELQKTADEGTPEPVMTRSDSRASNASYLPSVSRRTSRRETMSSVVMQDSPSRSQVSSPTIPSSTGLTRSASNSGPLRRSSSGRKITASDRSSVANAGTAVAEPIPEDRIINVTGSPPMGTDAHFRVASPGVPGVVSYGSPQTLIGQREMFIRNKSQGNLLAGLQDPNLAPANDAASVYSTSLHPNALGVADPDDLPLSQRKNIMRQSSMMSLSLGNQSFSRLPGTGMENTEAVPFNSHQPKRVSTLPPQIVREAQLANFRQSVQQDLRSGTPVMATTGRETPFTPSSLLGNREAEVQRNIEMQRNVLMGQKEAEAQRKEALRREKDFADRAFDERMRAGDFLEAHREAMRKMQKSARET
ncbi:hypothetical protein HIM_06520 [Hirsutella minnesotensis 3608]|uniref:TM7S3/TM198-like domain-containing protein n=1 Tax=Hirsutella minnesotensis 3608 TaxID=1043627 RepID=A0A0F7ZIZ2_9HYPO|nr:hypothetical protein HIM_06520 [Hirsutella minnesotensis 3608]